VEQIKFQKQQDQYEKLSDSLRKKMNVQVTDEAEASPPVPAGPTAAPKN